MFLNSSYFYCLIAIFAALLIKTQYMQAIFVQNNIYG